MNSAFGVDHGEVSKKLSSGAKAGLMAGGAVAAGAGIAAGGVAAANKKAHGDWRGPAGKNWYKPKKTSDWSKQRRRERTNKWEKLA